MIFEASWVERIDGLKMPAGFSSSHLLNFSASQLPGLQASQPSRFPASQPLRHITFNINRLFFLDVVPFIADIRYDAGIFVEAIFLIFAPVVN